jgi:toxin-antitoxin system PIN domain toxin
LILPDVNVLIYAFRADSGDHKRYKVWLEEVVNGPAAYGISPQVLSAVARICTHPRIYVRPSATDEVFAFCGLLLSQPQATLVTPGPRHWPLFRELCRESRATGNLVQDAWNAALAIESGCEWITTDRDYARFKGLKWHSPF